MAPEDVVGKGPGGVRAVDWGFGTGVVRCMFSALKGVLSERMGDGVLWILFFPMG